MERKVLKGKIWVLLDKHGKLIEDIDTDQIYHNAYLHITEVSEMGQYALGNLEGWRDFAQKCHEGDMVIAGRNFGAGSSRQQAVDCFISLKVSLILAPSFSAIYFRNAVNSGFPILKIPNLERLVSGAKLVTGDVLEIELKESKAKNLSKGLSFEVEPMSSVQYDIYKSGDLFKYGRILENKS